MDTTTKRIIQAGLIVLAVAVCFVDCRLVWLVVGLEALLEWWTQPCYRDYIWEPMRPENLPRRTYREFDRWTPQFMALGCGLVGDFRLAYIPWPTFVRYFLPPDRRIKGEVSQSADAFAPSFSSVFTDGRMIETALFDEKIVQVGDERKLWLQSVSGVSVAELYAQHQRQVDLYEATYGAQALTVTPDRLFEFAQYGHRLGWWERKQLPPSLGIPQVPAGATAGTEVVGLGRGK